MATDANNLSAKALLQETLNAYGLGSLSTWAWQRFQQTQSMDVVMLEMRDRPEYQARFPYMDALRKGGHAITEAQAINYEQSAISLMRQAGLPSQFYNQPADFQALLEGQVSISELQDRITTAYTKVAFSDPSVRAFFAEHYGPGSDGALASYFLDPAKASPELVRQANAAEFGGWARNLGMDIATTDAEQIAAMNIHPAAVRDALTQLAQTSDLYRSTVSDTQDISAQKEGVEAAFGLSGDSVAAVRQRTLERQAGGSGATQSGAVTQQGAAVGTGSSQTG